MFLNRRLQVLLRLCLGGSVPAEKSLNSLLGLRPKTEAEGAGQGDEGGV